MRYGLNRFQPWTADHRLAIASWMAFGTTWWLVAGTSTFLSVLLFVLPSDGVQRSLARLLGEHVTRHTGASVSFASAIRPTWRTLRLHDVVVRRTEESSGIPDSMEFDLHIDELEIKVSLLWMLEGKGLVECAHIKGMRGVVDRRKCWNEYDEHGKLIPFSAHVPVPPEKRWRSEWYKGSFHLSSFVLSDVAVTLLQPEPTRPIRILVHNMKSDRFRRQFLVYDALCSTMDGSVDNRLFSLRPPVNDNEKVTFATTDEDCHQSIFHLDGLNMDIVRAGGATGPLSWITRGRIDVTSVFLIPRNYDGSPEDGATKKVRAIVDMNLTHLTASVPLVDEQISYLNAALVQPMVVYLNTNYVSIPIHAVLSIPLSYFNGAWSPYAAAMTDALSEGFFRKNGGKESIKKKSQFSFF